MWDPGMQTELLSASTVLLLLFQWLDAPGILVAGSKRAKELYGNVPPEPHAFGFKEQSRELFPCREAWVLCIAVVDIC
jgi:hypothetical protein